MGDRMRSGRGRLIRTACGVAAAAIVLLVLLPTPAAARITSGPCTDEDNFIFVEGTRYTPANDSRGNPVVLPDREGVVIEYTGTTRTGIRDHRGEIAVDFGTLGQVTVASWGHPNKPNPTKQKSGTYDLDEGYRLLRDGLPADFDLVGIFRVSGFHTGTEGTCEGFAMVKIEGNPLTTAVGATAVGGTVVTAAGVGLAAVAKARRRRV